MAFQLSPALAGGGRDTGTEITLSPGPTYTDYGDRLRMTVHESDGRLIKQRSLRQPKKKKWVWEGYTPNVPLFEDQYWTLFNHQEHVREKENGLNPHVYLKEDVTGELGSYDSATDKIVSDWVKCRIINVFRTVQKQGGVVRYNLEMVFTIDDPNLILY